MSASGDPSSAYSVGDKKTFAAGGENFEIEIIGFNHDNISGGGKAGISVWLTHVLQNPMYMNWQGKVGGTIMWYYYMSDVSEYLNGELFNSFPADLQSVIKTVRKADGGYYHNEQDYKIFCLSVSELGQYNSNSFSVDSFDDGNQYEGITSSYQRIKYMYGETSSPKEWWTRSNDGVSGYGSYRGIVFVNKDGTINNSYKLVTSTLLSSNQAYICFGFCI